MKFVYDTNDLTDLTPMEWPDGKKVFHPFTTVAPPTAANIKITGFNFNTDTWQYLEVATPEDVANQDEQLVNALFAIVELYELNLALEEKNADLEARVAALEGPKEPEGLVEEVDPIEDAK